MCMQLVCVCFFFLPFVWRGKSEQGQLYLKSLPPWKLHVATVQQQLSSAACSRGKIATAFTEGDWEL